MYAKENTTTPVPEGTHSQGNLNTELGTLPTTGFGEIGDSTDDHSGTVRGEDVNHRAQAGSGDGLGRRGKEVVALEPLTRIENNGEPDAEIVRLKFGSRHLPD